MNKMKILREIATILDTKTTKTDGHISISDNYPSIACYDNQIRVFYRTARMTNWFLPVGVPFIFEKRSGNSRILQYIGYMIGDRIYYDNSIDFNVIEGPKTIYSPIISESFGLVKAGWKSEEQTSFEDFVFKLATKACLGDFNEMLKIDFVAAPMVDFALLNNIGIVVSRATGTNTFYGILDADVNPSAGGNKVDWTNKYLIVLDLSLGDAYSVYGYLQRGEHVHPHVGHDGKLCVGNYGSVLNNLVNKGDITSFFSAMKSFLTSYSGENPFFGVPLHSDDVESLVLPDGVYDKYKKRLRTLT